MPVEHVQVQETQQAGVAPLLGAGHTFASITDKISAITQGQPASRRWWLGFGVTFALVVMLHFAIAYLLVTGVGIWGVNMPVAWGLASVHFAWWIVIGYAWTLLSA